MSTTGRVSVPALRILTYTILIKAVIGAVMLTCTVAAGIALRYGTTDLPVTGSAYIVCQTLGFVNIVACVMCLGGITALSKQFVVCLRIMVAVLLIECFTMVPAAAGMLITIINGRTATGVVNIIMLILVAARRLLIGAAFFVLTRGFGDALKECDDSASALGCDRLGAVYCCISAVDVTALIFGAQRAGILLLAAGWICSFAIIVLEVIIYRRVTDAAQRIWRKRAFGK